MIDINNAQGVIFDLDGTLVSSALDFAAIRQQIGCPEGIDVLKFISTLRTESQRSEASQTVLQHELADAEDAVWLSGAKEFINQLVSLKLPMAIVTRNCCEATRVKMRNNDIPINLVLTREDAPAKPKPDALLQVAKTWQLPPEKLLYIGDYIYDEQAANNAGMPFQYSPFGV